MSKTPRPPAVMKKTLQLRAFQLRRRGLSLEEIANVLGIGVTLATQYVREEFEKAKVAVEESLEDYRAAELIRLDRMYAAIWPGALAGRLDAIKVCLKISEQRADLLGMNQSSKANVNVTQHFNGLPTEEIVELARQRGIPVPAGLLPEPLPGPDTLVVPISREAGVDRVEVDVPPTAACPPPHGDLSQAGEGNLEGLTDGVTEDTTQTCEHFWTYHGLEVVCAKCGVLQKVCEHSWIGFSNGPYEPWTHKCEKCGAEK